MRRPDHTASSGTARLGEGGGPNPFETRLRQHEDARHRRIVEAARPFPRAPAGFACEDMLGLPATSGFLPLDQAAERMSATVEDVMKMVEAGLLEADRQGYVRPAVVTVMGVREGGGG